MSIITQLSIRIHDLNHKLLALESSLAAIEGKLGEMQVKLDQLHDSVHGKQNWEFEYKSL